MCLKKPMAEAKAIVEERKIGSYLRVATWNATTINGRIDELLVLAKSADILCVQEAARHDAMMTGSITMFLKRPNGVWLLVNQLRVRGSCHRRCPYPFKVASGKDQP